VGVVHTGIAPPPPGPPDPRLAELATRGPVVGALTLLRPGKGLETLLQATPLLRKRHPQAQVCIVGEGPDLAQLRAQAEALGVADAVHFLGPTEDPLSALRGMSVFVHPSWAESFPYVILEAMAVGAPIVASDVGGIGEAVARDESGLLVPPRDARALAHAVGELLDDGDRAARLASRARTALSRFTCEAMIEAVTDVYAELARPSSALRPLLGFAKGRSLG